MLSLYTYRYLVDGLWQHDPLYPTECDNNGHINNVIVIGGSDSRQEEEGSHTSEISKSADDAAESVKRDDVVSIQEQPDNISHYRQTVNTQGDLPTGGKADVTTDTATVNCKSQGKYK